MFDEENFVCGLLIVIAAFKVIGSLFDDTGLDSVYVNTKRHNN